MTMRRGAISSFSWKHKLNGKSYTEAELIGVDDKLSDMPWHRYFLESQGYPMIQNIIYQNNKSTITLERNGKASSSKRMKHIQVKYFFVKDK